MRTVFTGADETIHVFAQQGQKNGRCSNVFFEGKKLYSYGYHYLLAEFIENQNGERAVVINDSGYSVTTSKHISIARQALSHYKRFNLMSTDPKKVLYQCETLFQKLETARKPEKYTIEIESLYKSMCEWLEWSEGVKDKYFFLTEEIYNSIQKPIGEAKEDIKLFQTKKIAAEEAEKERQRKAAIKHFNKSLKDFYAYKINRIYTSMYDVSDTRYGLGNKDYLRISKDGTMVETTQNVKIPIEDAKKLYLAIVNKVDIKGYQISHYVVTSINGTLKIGCHNIDIKSVHKVGAKLLTMETVTESITD